jgi:hypothetical protein
VPAPGSPLGMILPVRYLSPFRLSIHTAWQFDSSDRRIIGCDRQVGRIRYVGNHAVIGSFANTLLGKPNKTNVGIVEQLLANAKLFVKEAITALFFLGSPKFVALDRTVLIAFFNQLNTLVVRDQFRFLGLRGAAEAVIGRIAKDDNDLRPALYLLRGIEFRPFPES